MNTPQQSWSTLREHRPLAAHLALLTCLPIRVTPSLVRLARLTLLPEGGTDVEADLWLSELVQARAVGGFIYHPEVRTFLREELRVQSTLLDTVWNLVYRKHAQWLSSRSQLEEELTWRLLRNPADLQIDALWRTIVNDLDKTTHAEGIARWILRAIPDLPPGSLQHESGRRAYLGAHILLGDATVLGTDEQHFYDTGHFAFATRHLARRTIFVGLYEHGLLIDPMQPIQNGHAVEIPETRPLWLQVQALTTREAPVVLTFEGDRPVQKSIGRDRLNLRFLDGSEYELQPRLLGQAANKLLATGPSGYPRVELSYDVEWRGETQNRKLPFTIYVLGDFQVDTGEFIRSSIRSQFVDLDGINKLIKIYRPRIHLSLQTKDGAVDSIEFESIDNFSPSGLMRNVPALRTIAELRDQCIFLSNISAKYGSFARYIVRMFEDRFLLESYASYKPDPTMRGIRYQKRALLDILRAMDPPLSRDQEWSLFQAIVALADYIVSNPDSAAEVEQLSLQKTIRNLNKGLSRLLENILRHPKFRALECSWLGLEHLLNNAPPSENLRIRVTSITKEQVLSALLSNGASNSVDTTTYHILGEELGATAFSFGCLIGDFYFDESPRDIDLLNKISTLCALNHIPFIAGSQYRSTLTKFPDDKVQPFTSTKVERYAWRSLRARPESRYLVLTTPRFMARRPIRMQIGSDIMLDETTESRNNAEYVWANPAYLLAASIGRSFQRYGWFARITGIGTDAEFSGLPWDEVNKHSALGLAYGTLEVEIGKRMTEELITRGIAFLTEQYNSGPISFRKAPSVFDTNGKAHDVAKASTLPYLLILCAFAHCIKLISVSNPLWDSPDSLEVTINTWLASYVSREPNLSEMAQARSPLNNAEFRIRTIGSHAHEYEGMLSISPRFQLSESPATVSLQISIPSKIFA